MKKELRHICYDAELHLEAYCFEGIDQPFPNHFHGYYVFGYIETGNRCLSCKNKAYAIGKGDILIFHPHDSHGCVQMDGDGFAYRGLNIAEETMRALMEELTGERMLPHFSKNVIQNEECGGYFRALHQRVMEGSKEFEKEELLLLFFSRLLEQYGQSVSAGLTGGETEIEQICAFMQAHFAEHITLEQLCRWGGFSKSTLLRAFTKSKGVTPYRYLQAIRIEKAKELLEKGVSPMEAAMGTGFADQSHFSNTFHRFIGLSPAAYGRIFQEGSKGKNG